ncbi:MAG: hypothetical protein Q9191_005851 [Dirinaria sp. TL-2023a]
MPDSVAALIRNPRPATLAGVRLVPAGRLGPGWILLREAAQLQGPVPARPGVLWDGRFRLHAVTGGVPPDAVIDALGADAAGERSRTGLPAAVLAVLPALRRPDGSRIDLEVRFGFEPAMPAVQMPVFFASATDR